VLFALDDARPGDEEQLAAADLNLADLESSCQLPVTSCQLKTIYRRDAEDAEDFSFF
jgi:hypothetical protein